MPLGKTLDGARGHEAREDSRAVLSHLHVEWKGTARGWKQTSDLR